jgi:hypothetical protein
MANDFTALGSALFARLNNQGTVGVYYGLAPQGGTPPYCIIQRQAAVNEYTFGTAGGGVSTDYMVKIVSNRNWPGEAYQVYTHVHNAMQDAPLTVTGFTLLRCRRQSTIEYRDTDGYWHVGGLYRLDLWES